MYKEKANFFDGQIDAPWANDNYSSEELLKSDKIFKLCKIKQGSKIIEPGCGSGRLTMLMAERCGDSGKIVAIDVSPGMIKKAKERLTGYNNVEVSCLSVEDAAFENGNYDAVICHQVFPHFEDKKAVLNKLVATLKTGGFFIISHFIGIEEINDVHRKSNSPVVNDIMPSNDEIKELFEAAGLELVLIEDKEDCYNVLGRKKT